MNQKEKSIALKPFSDEDLQKELTLRDKKRKGKLLGYRVIMHGDDMNYGKYQDVMIVDSSRKVEYREYAEKLMFATSHGAHIEEIFKNTPVPDRIN